MEVLKKLGRAWLKQELVDWCVCDGSGVTSWKLDRVGVRRHDSALKQVRRARRN